jgi:hypothetical protein
MIDFLQYQKEQVQKKYLTPYIIQLLFESDPQLDKDRLLEAIRKNCGNVEPIQEESGIIGFVHPEKVTRSLEGSVPAQTLFTFSEISENPIDVFDASLIQTWDWQQAQDFVSRTKHVVTITDSFTNGLIRQTRLKLMHDVILSVLEISNPLAIHWIPSQRIVNPVQYKEDLTQGGQIFSSAVNVRMFKIKDTDEKVMDTMGLTGLGLPDLQCNFVGLNPAQVGIYLYQLAEYVFQRGDVFRNGDTVDGLLPEQRWRIRKQGSYIDPIRLVLDVVPGEYAPKQTEPQQPDQN